MGPVRQRLRRGKGDAAAVASDAGLWRGGFARAGPAQEQEEGGKEKSERAGGEKKANRAESEEEKGRENISFIFFQINFPNDFQFEFEFNSNFSQS